jgi:hypothetical protein
MVFQVPLLGYTLADDTLQQQNMCLSMQQFDIKTTPDQIQSQRCKKTHQLQINVQSTNLKP